MAFQAYWRILKRRWLLVLIPALVVLVIGLVTYDAPAQNYNAGIRFIAGQQPSTAADESDEERLANWQTSEYIVNTLSTWIRSGQFAELVSDRLDERGLQLAAIDIRNGMVADDSRSIMTMSFNYGDAAMVEEVLKAAAGVLIEDNAQGLPQLGGETAELVQLDEPIVNPVSPSILSQLDLPFRIGLALAAGVGLAIFVDYLDPAVYERQQLESMGLSVLSAIPRERGASSKQEN